MLRLPGVRDLLENVFRVKQPASNVLTVQVSGSVQSSSWTMCHDGLLLASRCFVTPAGRFAVLS